VFCVYHFLLWISYNCIDFNSIGLFGVPSSLSAKPPIETTMPCSPTPGRSATAGYSTGERVVSSSCQPLPSFWKKSIFSLGPSYLLPAATTPPITNPRFLFWLFRCDAHTPPARSTVG